MLISSGFSTEFFKEHHIWCISQNMSSNLHQEVYRLGNFWIDGFFSIFIGTYVALINYIFTSFNWLYFQLLSIISNRYIFCFYLPFKTLERLSTYPRCRIPKDLLSQKRLKYEKLYICHGADCYKKKNELERSSKFITLRDRLSLYTVKLRCAKVTKSLYSCLEKKKENKLQKKSISQALCCRIWTLTNSCV